MKLFLERAPGNYRKVGWQTNFYIDTAFRLQLILFTKFKLDCLVLMHHIIVNQKYKFNYAWLKRAMLCEIT